jgi:hypothetical protein
MYDTYDFRYDIGHSFALFAELSVLLPPLRCVLTVLVPRMWVSSNRRALQARKSLQD